MTLLLGPEQERLRREVTEFARQESQSFPARCEKDSEFPWEYYRRICDRGWMGLIVPKEYGGMGGGAIECTLVYEAFARELLLYPANLQLAKMIVEHGSDKLRLGYLPKLASGEYLTAMMISEPEAGSSFTNLRTNARREDGHYVVNGHKTHINHADEAHVFGILARTEVGLTFLIGRQETPGKRTRRMYSMTMPTSPMYSVWLEDFRVPLTDVIGKEGGAIKVFASAFNLSRICMASVFVGYARCALEQAVAYAKRRQVGENHVSDFQGIRWMLADMVTDIEASRLLRDKAAWMEDAGQEHVLESAMAKLFAQEAAERVATKVFSFVGGNACYAGTYYERVLREIVGMKAGGGSSEVLRNLVAAEALKRQHI